MRISVQYLYCIYVVSIIPRDTSERAAPQFTFGINQLLLMTIDKPGSSTIIGPDPSSKGDGALRIDTGPSKAPFGAASFARASKME